MRAVAITAPGRVEVIESADPSVREGETEIAVSGVGLNRLDASMLAGDFSLDYPHVIGSDIVGRVNACPSGRFSDGDRVLVNPALPQDGVRGWNSTRRCDFVRILGLHVPGGLAERVVVKDDQVYRAPHGLTDETAAAIPLDYLTAWRMLTTRARVTSGEAVLVWGAAGPLGCAATAIAAHLGARPIAVGSRSGDAAILEALGAVGWVDYTSPDFEDSVRAIAGGDVPVVFESVGKASWSRSIELVAPSGRIVICGTTSGGNGTTDLTELYYKQINVLGSRMGYPDEFEAMLEAFAQGLRPPPVADTFPMSEPSSAFAQLSGRVRAGKIVLLNDL